MHRIQRRRHIPSCPVALISVASALAATLLFWTGGIAYAKSLRSILGDVSNFAGVRVPSNVIIETVKLQREAVRSSDFVAAATAPGFFYWFSPELGVPERLLSSRGPVFVEPAETVGKGRFDVGLAYLYSNFTKLDGKSLTKTLDELNTVGSNVIFRIHTEKFTLRSQVLQGSLTYGLTDRWDVNVLVPLFATRMDVRAESNLLVGLIETSKRVDAHDEPLGVGDILLRTKYRLTDAKALNIASVFTLRLPSGKDDNFQGLGDVVLTPSIAATRRFGANDLHLNLGLDVNADELRRSRLRYAAGVTLQPLERFAFVLSAIGSSAFMSDHFAELGVFGDLPRTDIADVGGFLKVTLAQNLLLYAGAIIPVTTDGLRPDVTPAGGLQGSF